MKAIRIIAASMFLITGILHIYWAFTELIEISKIVLFAGGILYPAIGVLLLMKKRFALWLGLINTNYTNRYHFANDRLYELGLDAHLVSN